MPGCGMLISHCTSLTATKPRSPAGRLSPGPTLAWMPYCRCCLARRAGCPTGLWMQGNAGTGRWGRDAWNALGYRLFGRGWAPFSQWGMGQWVRSLGEEESSVAAVAARAPATTIELSHQTSHLSTGVTEMYRKHNCIGRCLRR